MKKLTLAATSAKDPSGRSSSVPPPLSIQGRMKAVRQEQMTGVSQGILGVRVKSRDAMSFF